MSNPIRSAHDVTWRYAWACLTALRARKDIPPVPRFNIWSKSDKDEVSRITGTAEIVPQPVTHNGWTVYGR